MLGTKEQRQHARFAASEDMRLEAVLHGGLRPVATFAVDVSLGGIGLLVPSDDAAAAEGASRLSLRWGDEARDFEISVVRFKDTPSAPGGFVRLGARFRQADPAFLRALCRLIERHSTPGSARPDVFSQLADGTRFQEVSETRRIRRFLAYCCNAGKQLTVHDAAGKPRGDFSPGTFSNTGVSGTLTSRPNSGLADEARYLVLPTLNGLSVLTVSAVECTDAVVIFKAPFRLHQGAHRRHARFRPTPPWAPSVEVLHPALAGRLLSSTLRDYGLGGVSIVIDPEADVLLAGTRLDSGMLRLPDGHSIAFRGIVRHLFQDEQGLRCAGIELVNFAGAGRNLWIRSITERTNPALKEAGDRDVEDVWRIFERSGYLQEKPANRMTRMQNAYVRTWRELLSEDTAAKSWVYEGPTHPLGTVSASQIYGETWLIHHLAVDRELQPERKLAVLSALIHRALIPWFIASSPPKNMLLFTDPNSSFNKQAWFDFLEPRRQPHTVSMKRFVIRELPTNGWRGTRPAHGIRVDPADPELLELVSSHLHVSDGDLAWRALDLAADRLASTAPRTPAPALDRFRQVFVARHGQTALGFALVESASSGANVFRLYDTCRIVLLTDKEMTGLGAPAHELLLAQASNHFRQLGSHAFLLLCDEDCPLPTPEGCFETAGMRAVVTPELFPQWIDYLDDLWVRR